MPNLGGHLGDRTAALVHGQLSPVQAERAWGHVMTCPGCREAVEQQAIAKQALGGLRGGHDLPAPPLVPTSWLDPAALEAWEQVAAAERRARRRTTRTVGVLGGGALTASLAVAVVLGAGSLTAPASTPTPPDLTAEIGGASPGADTGASSGPGSATSGTVVATWTGTSTGGETSRAVREHRSR